MYVVHRALSKVFQDPLKARAEAVKDALNSIEQGAGEAHAAGLESHGADWPTDSPG